MTGGLRRDLGSLPSYATLIGILVGAGIFRVTSDAATEGLMIGFRVATIPEPSTAVLGLLALAGVLAFGWRRRKR